MFSLRQILREMLAEKTRLILTILAVAWGTFAVASMLSVGEGLRVTFGDAMNAVGKGIIFVRGGRTSVNYHGHPINQKVNLYLQDYQLIKNVPGIKLSSPVYKYPLSIHHGQKSFPSEIKGVAPDYSIMRNIYIQPGGRFLDKYDMKNSRRVIVLGNKVAAAIFPTHVNPVGKYVYLKNQPFLVIGVTKTKLQFVGPRDAYKTWIPATTYFALTQQRNIKQIALIPQNPDAGITLQKRIRKIFALNHGLDPNDITILHFRNFQNMQNKTQELFAGMEVFLGIIGTLTLIIAGVGIANVMFISIKRATREIGIRMAIGARSYQILIHYVIEAIITTAIGGILGLLFTKLIITGIDAIPIHAKIFSMLGKPHPILSPLIEFVVIVILGLIGFFAGFFPARKAASIDPAVALRQE